ncbi:MAG: CRTAC1 family protein [Verrucomicrobia bacterium]|nr:MAG: CRTAC1 family protein [Verrucomicrobiota bacterium]
MDIVAANWGRNTKYQRYLDRPAKIFYGDFNRAGKVAVVEAFYDPDLKKVVPWPDLDALSRALPFVLERFPTCRAYSTAGVLEVLGTSQVGELSASTLDSMIFLNRGGRFDGKPLPPEAQFAPAFAVCVGDYDGDGNEDIFLSQNFFEVDAETSRYDAGLGLWLRGDGRGNFQAVPGRESGVRIFGEQRGAALCDYDRDGRVDLVVTQNGAETKLYHNVGGQAGLRVRLRGPASNPQAVGAHMRLSFGTRQGPMREVHAGSGYWSQDSAVQVLGTAEAPTQIQVRWPGGRVTTSDLREKAREISVDSTGQLEVIRTSEL